MPDTQSQLVRTEAFHEESCTRGDACGSGAFYATSIIVGGRSALIVLALVVFAPPLIVQMGRKVPPTFLMPDKNCASPAPTSQIYREGFIRPEEMGVAQIHSPAIVQMANGKLLAVWPGGTREGVPDVALYSSIWDPPTQTWSAVRPLVTQEQTQREVRRYIKKLGNPVLYTDTRGRTWVFYVTVSIGGWSLSNINFKISSDNAQTWSPAKRLTITPFINDGTLVKGQPFTYADGTIGLPVYRDHGALSSFSELARLNEDGEVIEKVRMTYGRRGGGQPSIVPFDATRALGLLRYKGGEPQRVLITRTDDAGQTWTTVVTTDVPNADSALMALRLHDGTVLLVFNNSTQSRSNLSLAKSSDNGASWKMVHAFEDEKEPDSDGGLPEFSYPYIMQTCSGEIHLLYSWRRKKIKHVIFNEAWVRADHG